MKKKIVFLLALSVIFATAITMNSTLAPFTTYVTAQGGHVLHLNGDTDITEDFEAGTKHVVITNDGPPVYVRVKAFAGSECPLRYVSPDGSWSEGKDGYWYYNEVLGIGSTSELLIEVNLPAGATDGDQVNVVVIYESTPQQYDDSGNPIDPKDADWDRIVEGGNET